MFLLILGFVEATKCFRSCVPWEEICDLKCNDIPWVEQPHIVARIIKDKEFRRKAFEFVQKGNDLEMPYGSYSACPSWYQVCNRMAVNVPWYLQEKWVDKLDTDKDFVAEAIANIIGR